MKLKVKSKLFKSIRNLFKGLRYDFDQIEWPNLKVVISRTFTVLLISGIISLYLLGLDVFFAYLRTLILAK